MSECAAELDTLEEGMSYSFYVACARPPTCANLIDALNEPLCEWPEESPAKGDWHGGFRYHPYVRDRSARGVELAYENGMFEVRLITCSSRGDYELGMSLVRALAIASKSHIAPERADSATISCMELSRGFGDAWIDAMVEAGPTAVVEALEERGGTISLSGARRPLHCGPRFVADLRAQTSKGSFSDRFLAAMLALQNVDEEVYYPAQPMQTIPKGYNETRACTVAVWEPGVAYLFPRVEYFALSLPNDELLYIPQDAAPRVAGDRWTFLDETSALVEACPADAWSEVLGRARFAATTIVPPQMPKDTPLLELDDLV